MKRVILILAGALIGVAACMAQEPVYYVSAPTVTWTPASAVPDGTAFLAGDTVEYRVYAWDDSAGLGLMPAVGAMTLMTTWIDADPLAADAQGEESVQITFIERLSWRVALAATHIDGGGNRTDYPEILYSTIAQDTASGIPFVYIPSSGGVLPGSGPRGLRDAGM